MSAIDSEDLCIGMLVTTVQELSLARDIESVMHIVRKVARELTGADGATFVLRDGDSCYYADEDAISPLWKGSRFPIKTCISGWAMINRQSVVIEDIYSDDRIPVDAYRPTFVKSLAMVPIRTMNPLGAIGNYWAKRYNPSHKEVKLLQALADITAVSIENINVRNNLENTVAARTKELVESLEREKESNQMKSAFVTIASHEFRTPLSSILSSTSLIDGYHKVQQYDKLDKHINRIKSSVSNLTGILDDFLSLEKLEQGKIEPVQDGFNLQEFLREVAAELDGMCKNGQSITIRHSGRTEVLLDKRIMRNVLLNLLSNAIKYSEQDVELISEISGSYVRIRVVDRGIGIPETEQKNLFTKFFRAANAINIQGTGLGLTIVKRYVELLKGRIDFKSHYGEGTTFIVTFPDKLWSTESVTQN